MEMLLPNGNGSESKKMERDTGTYVGNRNSNRPVQVGQNLKKRGRSVRGDDIGNAKVTARWKWI